MRLVLLLILCQASFAAVDAYRAGVALFEQQRYEEALPLLKQAVKETPQSAVAWKALGAAYAAQARYEEAASAFERACTLDANLADACYFWGRALYALDRFTPSLQALEAALAVDPQPGRVHEALGQTHEALGHASEAEAEFRQAVRSSPRYGIAYGRFLVRQGRTEEAMPHLLAASKANPRVSAVWLELGRAWLQLNEPSAAVTALTRAVQLDPLSEPAQVLLRKARLRAEVDRQPHP